MKHKKNFSIVFTTLIVMLLILIAVVIIWLVIRTVSEPHFKIYENVCEKKIQKQFICEDDTLVIGIIGDLDISEYTTNADIKCFRDDKLIENCELIEVDAIEIEEYLGVGSAYCYPNIDVCKYVELGDGQREIYGIIKISKQDLSIKWFDVNCECIECYDERDINEGEQLNPTYCNEDKREWTFCQKYSCGEKYIIEVWSQIK